MEHTDEIRLDEVMDFVKENSIRKSGTLYISKDALLSLAESRRDRTRAEKERPKPKTFVEAKQMALQDEEIMAKFHEPPTAAEALNP